MGGISTGEGIYGMNRRMDTCVAVVPEISHDRWDVLSAQTKGVQEAKS